MVKVVVSAVREEPIGSARQELPTAQGQLDKEAWCSFIYDRKDSRAMRGDDSSVSRSGNVVHYRLSLAALYCTAPEWESTAGNTSEEL